MKQNFKFTVLALAVIAIVYTACHKSGESPDTSKSTIAPKVASVQIAQSLASIFSGEYGGFSFNDGLDYPASISINKKGRLSVQSSDQDPECGSKLDTTIQESLDLTDTVKLNIWTRLKYELTCTEGAPSGVSIYDSLNMSGTLGSYNISLKEGENLLLKALNPGDDNSKYSFNGTINSNTTLNPTKSGVQAESGIFNFTFISVVIDPENDADVISGSATFSTKGTIGDGSWDYKGTILFLGNHQAKISIDGTVYTADLLTGTVN